MKTDLQHKLSQALLRGNPVSSPLSDNAHVNPVSEMPMILTLEQLQPNPDNPRQGRNPRYEEIKSSIRARGLDSVPKVPKHRGVSFISSVTAEIRAIRSSLSCGRRHRMSVSSAFMCYLNPGRGVCSV